ncbi:hypothetical protein OAL10_12705 [Gammaproteobacteria bacterium]|nr:hypothetical protein [Gammaproteobacteria bacterium]
MAEETVSWWASIYSPDRGRRVALTSSDGKKAEITWFAESQHFDYKPITSPDGKMVAFFRVTNGADKETGDVSLWKSKICVMDIDGTNVRELTGDDDFNGNLHWTRDGTNRITWWRITNLSGLPNDYSRVKIWRTGTDAKPGEEVMLSDVSDPEYFREFGYSHLRDGRMFMRRGSKKYFLLTPDDNGHPVYEPISYPNEPMYIHKCSISHDETKISYMKQTMENLPKGEYMGSVLCLADFDADNLTISNEIEFTEPNWERMIWYTSFTPDDNQILYTDNGRIYSYEIESCEHRKLSIDDSLEYRYPNVAGSIK